MTLTEKINNLSLSALNCPFCDIFVSNGWNQIFRFIKGHPTKNQESEFGINTFNYKKLITDKKSTEIVNMILDEMLELTAPERKLRESLPLHRLSIPEVEI